MDIKFCLLIFLIEVSTQATVLENELQGGDSNHPINEVLDMDGYEDEEDFLDDIDEDIDYFYTYEAIKNLENIIQNQDPDSNRTIDMAEKFFMNFEMNEDEYDEEYSYDDYDYEISHEKILEESDDTNSDYIELDEIDHDDFEYFTLDTIEDNKSESLNRDTIMLIIVLVVVMLVLVVMLAVYLSISCRKHPETIEEEKEQIDNDNLLAEVV